MNMMTMSKMEEAASGLHCVYCDETAQQADAETFHAGFRSGVAWVWRQERSALAHYMVGGVALIAAERMLQIEVKGWTPEHDDQHADCELIWAAEYYCSYDPVAAEILDLQGYKDLIEDRFPSSWDARFKKRNGFPDPTDMDLAKAGALIAAELDRRARERERVGTGNAVSIMVSGQVESGASPHGVGVISQYQAATERPEDEA